MEYKIREFSLEDWEDIYSLNLELGFPLPKEKVKKRLEQLGKSEQNKIFVAQYEGRTIGYIHGSASERVYDENFFFIHTLIVSEVFRGRSAGHRLMVEMEKWVAAKGYLGIGLWSRIDRVEAHRFYENHNYVHERTQKYFIKDIERYSG